MDVSQIAALALLCVFYLAYFAKTLSQKQHGITTNQMGKGTKPARVLCIERLLRLATFAIVPVEACSVLINTRASSSPLVISGMIAAAIGVALFIIAMLTMRSNWRAGIPSKKETQIVQTGIYCVSRNPAFLGFDLMYIGILAAYPNIIHVLFCAFAILMLHLQILEEEKYLAATFGDAYIQYKRRAARYFFFF